MSPELVDIVEKLGLTGSPIFLSLDGAFSRQRRGGPRLFVRIQPTSFPLALRTIRMGNVAPFISWREFCGRSDFEFFNRNGQKPTLQSDRRTSALHLKPDITGTGGRSPFIVCRVREGRGFVLRAGRYHPSFARQTHWRPSVAIPDLSMGR